MFKIFILTLFCNGLLFTNTIAQNRAIVSDKINGTVDLKLMNWGNSPPITINSVTANLGTPSNKEYEEMTGEYTLEYSGNFLFFLEDESGEVSHLYSWVINNDELFISLKTQTVEIGDNITTLQYSYPNSWSSRDTLNKAFYLFSNNSDDYLLINWNNEGRISKISLIVSPI